MQAAMTDALHDFDGGAIRGKSRSIGGELLVVDSPAFDSLDASREIKVQDIREDIVQGCYQVDPKAVADAMLRRLLGLRSGAAGEPGRA
jgi:hypothetical protein